MSICVKIRKRLSRSFMLETEFETAGRLAILGASGAGKSMTLKCIAGIETPDEGFISVNGRVLFDSRSGINLKPRVRRAGFLFQNYALFPTMSALDNVMAGIPAGFPAAGAAAEKRRQAAAWLARMELSGFERRKPRQLSGGQQQRLALARLFAACPDFILLDEPFSALDSSLREMMHLVFLALLRERSGVILVTHSRDEAYKLCGEILVMDAGKTLVHGARDEVFARPRAVQAARVTGCKNISPVRRTAEAEVYALDWDIKLRLPCPVPPETTHIGIRAHDITPVFGAGNGGSAAAAEARPYNTMRPFFTRLIDEPFEHVRLFINADAAEEQSGRGRELWWKTARGPEPALPSCFFFPPEKLLLLRE